VALRQNVYEVIQKNLAKDIVGDGVSIIVCFGEDFG
jgi:hypothetical protein